MLQTDQWFELALLLALPLLVAGLSVAIMRLALWLSAPPATDTLLQKLGWRGVLGLPLVGVRPHAIRLLTPALQPLAQAFEYLAPQKWVVHALQTLRPQLDVLVDDVVERDNSILWENMPVTLKNRVYERMHREIPGVLDDIIEEFGDQADLLIDPPHLFGVSERSHPASTLRLLDAGTRPLIAASQRMLFLWAWLACSVATLVFVLVDSVQLLLTGLWLASLTATWMQYRWIMRPEGQWRAGDWTKLHQAAVKSMAQPLADELLTPRHWVASVMDGPASRNTHLIIKRHVGRLLEHASIRTFLQMTVGAHRYVELKRTLTMAIAKALRAPFEDARFNRMRAESIRTLIERRLSQWPHGRTLQLVAPVVRLNLGTHAVLSTTLFTAAMSITELIHLARQF